MKQPNYKNGNSQFQLSVAASFAYYLFGAIYSELISEDSRMKIQDEFNSVNIYFKLEIYRPLGSAKNLKIRIYSNDYKTILYDYTFKQWEVSKKTSE